MQYKIFQPSAPDTIHQLVVIKQFVKNVLLFLAVVKILGSESLSNEMRLRVEIYDLVVSGGLSFNLAQKPRFKKVLELAKKFSKV